MTTHETIRTMGPKPSRATWSGAIRFGVVHVPVKLYSATDDRDVSFRRLCAQHHGPVRQRLVCSVEEETLDTSGIVKGYEYSKGQYVVVADDDLGELPVPSKKTIDIGRFVEAAEIDPLYVERSYYLGPEATGERAYGLIVAALSTRGLVGLAKLTLRTREQLCALRVVGGQLVLSTLRYADEVRAPVVEETHEVAEAELQMALSLVDALRAPLALEDENDEYRVALLARITSKLEGDEDVVRIEAQPAPATSPVDLMAALRASVEAATAEKAPTKAAPKRRIRKKAAA